jgi:hypothetical protein
VSRELIARIAVEVKEIPQRHAPSSPMRGRLLAVLGSVLGAGSADAVSTGAGDGGAVKLTRKRARIQKIFANQQQESPSTIHPIFLYHQSLSTLVKATSLLMITVRKVHE